MSTILISLEDLKIYTVEDFIRFQKTLELFIISDIQKCLFDEGLNDIYSGYIYLNGNNIPLEHVDIMNTSMYFEVSTYSVDTLATIQLDLYKYVKNTIVKYHINNINKRVKRVLWFSCMIVERTICFTYKELSTNEYTHF